MIDDETFAEPPDVMPFHGGEADNTIHNTEEFIMTLEEFRARKRWDIDILVAE